MIGLKTSSPIDNIYLRLSRQACLLKLKEFKKEKSITLLVVTTHGLFAPSENQAKSSWAQRALHQGIPCSDPMVLCECETHIQQGSQAHPAP